MYANVRACALQSAQVVARDMQSIAASSFDPEVLVLVHTTILLRFWLCLSPGTSRNPSSWPLPPLVAPDMRCTAVCLREHSRLLSSFFFFFLFLPLFSLFSPFPLLHSLVSPYPPFSYPTKAAGSLSQTNCPRPCCPTVPPFILQPRA